LHRLIAGTTAINSLAMASWRASGLPMPPLKLPFISFQIVTARKFGMCAAPTTQQAQFENPWICAGVSGKLAGPEHS
jgi:hypothetical protein